MNFSINHERRINDSLKSFEKSGSLTTDQYMKIKALGSKKGILYRISKIHKDIFPPFRPIILAIGTSSCKLAKFLVAILSSITFNGFTVKVLMNLLEKLNISMVNFSCVALMLIHSSLLYILKRHQHLY